MVNPYETIIKTRFSVVWRIKEEGCIHRKGGADALVVFNLVYLPGYKKPQMVHPLRSVNDKISFLQHVVRLYLALNLGQQQ